MHNNELKPVVLMLHGWGGSFASTYGSTPLVKQLEAHGFNVLRIDLPGHGQCGGSHNSQDYSDLASMVEPHLPTQAMLAVGFSLGAKVILELAARNPARFSRIALGGLGDNAFAPEKFGKEVAVALELGVDAETSPMVSALVDYSQASGSDPFALAAVLRRPQNPTLTCSKLNRIKCPMLLINGEEDKVARPETDLFGTLENAHLTVIPGVNHLNLTSNTVFVDAVANFLFDQ